MSVYCFNSTTDFSSNVYVLSENKEVLLIDPGFFDEEIIKTIQDEGKLVGILLTHGHYDHIRGLEDYLNYFDVPIYAHKSEEKVLTNSSYNCSLIMFREDYTVKHEINYVEQGHLNIGHFDIKVILTDGHTPGSCSYYFKNENAIFVGDFIISSSIGRVDLPGGNEKSMERSIKRFLDLKLPLDTIIYSGHEKEQKISTLLKTNSFFR